jgi:transposase
MAYSMDLRRRVVAAYKDGEGSMRGLAALFRINLSSVRDWVALERRTGDVPPGHGGGRHRLVDAKREAVIWALLGKNADATLPELCDGLAKRSKVHVSPTTMFRVLRRMGVTRKKTRRPLPRAPDGRQGAGA